MPARLALLILLLAPACVPPTPADRLPRQPAPAAAAVPSPLAVTIGSQSLDGRVMKLRGTIRNASSDAVRGVRLRLVLLTHAGAGAEALETHRKDLHASLAPGATTALRWDVESMYLGAAGAGFDLEAVPKRLGDQDVPAPPGW